MHGKHDHDHRQRSGAMFPEIDPNTERLLEKAYQPEREPPVEGVLAPEQLERERRA